jgi:heme A synthase
MLSKNTLFAVSLFPYLGFLWFLTRSQETPRLALIGFYVLLIFVAVTIPAGIYAKVQYGQELANIDWLHGSAESFLTLSNVLVVLGFRQGIFDYQNKQEKTKVND